jgi:hypothetical protein
MKLGNRGYCTVVRNHIWVVYLDTSSRHDLDIELSFSESKGVSRHNSILFSLPSSYE